MLFKAYFQKSFIVKDTMSAKTKLKIPFYFVNF